MLHRPRPCVSKTAIFADPRAFPRVAKKSPFNSKGLRRRLAAARGPRNVTKTKARKRGRRRRNRFRHGGALCHRAVRAGAREQGRRSGAGRSQGVRRAGRVEPGSDAPRALAGVLGRRAGQGAGRRCSTRPASRASRRTSCAWSRRNRRLFAVREMIRGFNALVATPQGRGDRAGHRRRAAQRRAHGRNPRRAQAGHRQGRAGRRRRRSLDHRRAEGQARLAHGRRVAAHQAQLDQARDERGHADGHPRRGNLRHPQGADQEFRPGGRGLRSRPGALGRRRHRPRLRPRQRAGRRDGRVRERRARHGAQSRNRQCRHRDLRQRPRDQGRPDRQAHARDRGRAGRQGPARPRGRRARQSDRRQGPDPGRRSASAST